MSKADKPSVIICDDSRFERMRFYERQYENFVIYGVVNRNGELIETDPVDSVEKLHKILVKLRATKELPDIVLLDLFYKRPLPNVEELEKEFVPELMTLKDEFLKLREKINKYLIPSGVEFLKRIRLIDKITTDELPICVYTDKNFNFLLSEEFNTIYELDPGSIHKDRDFDEPNSMIPASTEYFRILGMIEKSKSEKTDQLARSSVFISHGTSDDWMKVQSFIERDLGVKSIELAQEPNQGNTIISKLDSASESCCFAVVIMSGDDKNETGAVKVRENVMHEIGFFQGRYGIENVCLVYENGVSVPSNLSGIVYLPYERGGIESVFHKLSKEIGSLKLPLRYHHVTL